MKKIIAAIVFCLGLAAWSDAGFPFLLRGNSNITPPSAPVATAFPQIDGEDWPQSPSTTVTFTAKPGTWSGSPTLTHNWHCVGGSSLGTGTTITLNTTTSGIIGCPLEVDETATIGSQSTTVTSPWIGPIQNNASPPTSPIAWETCYQGNVNAGSVIVGQTYTIVSTGTNTSWTAIGAANNNQGTSFVANAVGSGNGVAVETTSTCPGGATPTALPTAPARYAQNTHDIFPGCAIPPDSPTHTAFGDLHVWHFDPNGKTYNAWNALVGQPGGPPSATDIGHNDANGYFPLLDLYALLNPLAGYPGTLGIFGAAAVNPAGIIRPGDTIYVEAGFTGAAGDITGPGPGGLGGTSSIGYSTSDGTTSGTPIWTWVLPDPASPTPVVIRSVWLGGGNASAAYWIIQNFGVEEKRAQYTSVSLNGKPVQPFTIEFTANVANAAQPTHDIIIENNWISQWLGHSLDPWSNSPYPNSGGFSDGTSRTGSPTFLTTQEDPALVQVAADSGSTTLFANDIVLPAGEVSPKPIGDYIFSPGLYEGGGNDIAAPSTGIPSGSVITAVNGLTSATYNNLGTVTHFFVSDFPSLSGLTLQAGSPFTSSTPLGVAITVTSITAGTSGTMTLSSSKTLVAGDTIFSPATGGFPTSVVVNTGGTGTSFSVNSSGSFSGSAAANAVQVVGSGTTYATVAATPDAVNTAFTWNGSTDTWVSPGTFLPTTPSATPAPAYKGTSGGTTTNQLAWWNGSSWTNLGQIQYTIAACTDATTGCPGASNVSGCDPLVAIYPSNTQTGGCPLGTTWVGTTRQIGGGSANPTTFETLVAITPHFTITPAGYWNWNDFEGNNASAIYSHGLLAPSGNIDPSFPNLIQGVYCLSITRNVVRDFSNGISPTNTINSVVAYNRIKYIASDGMDNYSNQRVWWLNNLYTDASFLFNHQDCIQGGDTNGHGASPTTLTQLYGNDFVGNRCFQTTDVGNYFQRQIQCINNTENSYIQTYAALNICGTTESNGIDINGKFDVVVANTSFADGASVGVSKKGISGTPANSAPSTFGPVSGLLANNIGGTINRVTANISPPLMTNVCDPVAGDLTVMSTNINIPIISSTGIAQSSSGFCYGPTPVFVSSGTMGVFSSGLNGSVNDVTNWGAMDWRNGQIGISGLFNAFDPLASPVSPAIGWQSGGVPIFMVNTCIQAVFQFTQCPVQSITSAPLDYRPSPSFAGFTSPIVLTLQPGSSTGPATALPNTTANPVAQVGAYAITTFATTQGSPPVNYAAGLYQYCIWQAGLSNNCAADPSYPRANGWTLISTTNFNPPIIGQGTNLGTWQPGWQGANMQQPIADLAGNAWASTPSIGAYEHH